MGLDLHSWTDLISIIYTQLVLSLRWNPISYSFCLKSTVGT